MDLSAVRVCASKRGCGFLGATSPPQARDKTRALKCFAVADLLIGSGVAVILSGAVSGATHSVRQVQPRLSCTVSGAVTITVICTWRVLAAGDATLS
jgi:hypothetical protein